MVYNCAIVFTKSVQRGAGREPPPLRDTSQPKQRLDFLNQLCDKIRYVGNRNRDGHAERSFDAEMAVIVEDLTAGVNGKANKFLRTHKRQLLYSLFLFCFVILRTDKRYQTMAFDLLPNLRIARA